MRRSERREKKVTKLDSNYVKQQEYYIARQAREKKLLIRRLAAFAIIFTFIIGSLSIFHFQQRSAYNDQQQEYQQLEEDLQVYQSEQSSLEREIELLNDVDYLLQIARKDYFFSKEGEVIFTLPDEEPSY
ncbi:FtsB family cell division protein [Halalkalibacillus halophilus]|uniref:FtsB family cell division protein n=1 Tax=Halalkalibacillus halophilus TaxID=392827 RepID=UPI00042875C3|nr:septum formation initiator family protein [Halalkalibacillus halophilus]